MTIAAQMLRRALAQDLAMRKNAFVPLDKNAQQASGPGGAPVDPAAAAGAPPAGGAPMDMPPVDPAAAGAPVDPAMAGAPVDPAMMDPAAAGMPPVDPAMMAPPTDMPPMPEPDVNSAETDVDGNGKADTMVPLSGMKDFAVGLIEAMKGKKTREADVAEEAADAAGAPALPPGPITGLPGDLSGLPGPLPMKTASVLSRIKLKV